MTVTERGVTYMSVTELGERILAIQTEIQQIRAAAKVIAAEVDARRERYRALSDRESDLQKELGDLVRPSGDPLPFGLPMVFQ